VINIRSMDNPAVIFDSHGFTAPLAPHGVKYNDITGQDMGGVSPITGFPQSGYCVRYRHLILQNPDGFVCPVKVSGGIVPVIDSDFPVAYGSNIIDQIVMPGIAESHCHPGLQL
jgi:hypothetical protein